jgi:hypothetical protein
MPKDKNSNTVENSPNLVALPARHDDEKSAHPIKNGKNDQKNVENAFSFS